VHFLIRCFDPSNIIGSYIWRSMCKSFGILDRRLLWKPGEGSLICIREDGILGLLDRSYLSEELIGQL